MFSFSRWNSVCGYGTAGVSLCLVGYLVSREVPKVISLVSQQITTQPIKTPETSTTTKPEVKKTAPKAKTNSGKNNGSIWDSFVNFFKGWNFSWYPNVQV